MKTEAMEDNAKMIESLLERSFDYGKTSLELAKLKALDKTSDVISTVIPHAFVFVLIASFMLFLNLGIAFWLGEILGKIFFGFFIVTAFYGVSAFVLHFFLGKRIKKVLCEYFNKQLLK